MSDGIAIALITTLGAVLLEVVRQGRKLNRIGSDAREARDQTANTHSTNLRDDLDGVGGKVNTLSGQVHGLTRTLHRIEGWMKDLTDADTQLEDTMDRRKLAAQRDLGKLREEIPDIIRTELGQHVRDCPLRGPDIGGT